METECEAARGLLYRFGQMVDDGVDGPELTKISAMAKLKCGDVAMAVTTEAVQILGGYGYIRSTRSSALCAMRRSRRSTKARRRSSAS